MKYITTINNKEFIIDINDDSNEITINDQAYSIDLTQLNARNLVSMIINNRSLEAAVINPERDEWNVLLDGEVYNITVKDERAYRLAKARGELEADSGTVPTKSPMPGVIVKIPVAPGDEVKKGDAVVILESMKMENELRATRDGFVLDVKVSAGDSVEKDAVLVVIGDQEEADGE
ncbi:MAG: acetyl-CoA carboxylase biotin carboxyl carrier protein subunit [Chloroflexota bacterium]